MTKWMLRRLVQGLRVRIITINGEPYLRRYFVGRVFGVTFYLHEFLRGDSERWIHDHPWTWSGALVLTGGYVEERLRWLDPELGPVTRLRRLGRWRRWNRLGPCAFHRIVEPKPGTWTLFVHGRRCKGWGFLEPADISTAHHPRQFGVGYLQPLDVKSAKNWTREAPRAREAL